MKRLRHDIGLQDTFRIGNADGKQSDAQRIADESQPERDANPEYGCQQVRPVKRSQDDQKGHGEHQPGCARARQVHQNVLAGKSDPDA